MDLRVVVVGGSLAGLTAACLLRDAGCDVVVLERSRSDLSASGAGIVVQPDTIRYFERTPLTLDDVSVAAHVLRYLAQDGSIAFEEPRRTRFTSWNTLYRGLRDAFDDARYRKGSEVVAYDPSGSVQLAGGEVLAGDLVVIADGLTSAGRAVVAPGCGPRYAGYVGWRGTVAATALSTATRRALADAMVYEVVGGSDPGHIVAYAIPNPDGGTAAGDQLLNYVWYRNVAEDDLSRVMTDSSGVARPLSIPAGQLPEATADALRASARDQLAPALAEMVVRTPAPFVQVIVDIESERMVRGRLALIGDAAFTARPHAAAGTAKAAADAWTLTSALTTAAGDVDAALAGWEPVQLALGRALVARSRDRGERSQFRGTWVPGDPDLRLGLYAPGR